MFCVRHLKALLFAIVVVMLVGCHHPTKVEAKNPCANGACRSR